ncbi:MAG: D-glycero-beta-D-manno-heptose 1-phosphate adenylyltransferase [Candidatus Omnitrophota bacterium]
MTEKKIKTQEELAEIIRMEKTSGRKVGFTNGCFDILHIGHVRYLAEAKKNCDVLAIGVNSDSSVRGLKGETRPVNSQDARLEVLAALACVDYVTVFEDSTPEKLIKKLCPDILFKGGDWQEENVVGGDFVRSRGGIVRIIPYVDGYSTTAIIHKMRET